MYVNYEIQCTRKDILLQFSRKIWVRIYTVTKNHTIWLNFAWHKRQGLQKSTMWVQKNCWFFSYLLYHNLQTIYTNTIKYLPLLQNLMGFLLKWSHMLFKLPTPIHVWLCVTVQSSLLLPLLLSYCLSLCLFRITILMVLMLNKTLHCWCYML